VLVVAMIQVTDSVNTMRLHHPSKGTIASCD
jgi:hypothetical protein